MSTNRYEYTSSQFKNFYRDLVIQRQISLRYTPEHNGVSERKNQTIIEMTRSMLAKKKMPNQS